MFQRLKGRLRGEDGIALVLSLLVVAALTISTAALVALTSSNQRAFTRDRFEARAFNTAEQAFNEAIAVLRTVDNGTVANGSRYPTVEGSTETCCNNLGTWWAEKNSGEWKIHTSGLSPEGDVLRKLTVRTFVQANTVVTNPSPVWGYGFFVASPPSCTTIVGTAGVTVSTYINGDLCMNGTNSIAEPNASGPQTVELYVKGKLYITGSANVGTSSRAIKLANIVGGCVRNGTNRICSQATQSRVYASSYGATQLSLTKPVVDAAGTYASGNWSTPVCSTGSFTFDNDTTRNTSVGSVDLFPGSAYDCTVYDGGGGYVGRLAWVPGTSTLTIDGVIYIDGNLLLNGGDQAQYTGWGSIYINGTVTTNGNSTLCGPGATVNGSTCDGLWDPDLGALTIVAVNAGNVSPAWAMSGNAEYNVLAFVVGHFQETGTAKVTGPVITDSAAVAGTADHTNVANPPVGTPGGSTTTYTSNWKVVPGSWEQKAISSE